MVTAKTA